MRVSICILTYIFIQTSISAQINHFETIVYGDDEWSYLVSDADPVSNWRDLGFDDSSWSKGNGSIGYGDGDDLTELEPCQSVFMRREFEIIDKDDISHLIFHADYDDGFVAYLNGQEIVRSNMVGQFPNFNQDATDLREAEMYQGGIPIEYNIDEAILNNYLTDGVNILAIQTHNFNGTNSSDMTSLYWLSAGLKSEDISYGEVPDWFSSNNFFQSTLPIVRINTLGQQIPDEPSINALMEIVYNGPNALNDSQEPANEFSGNISIELRGNSSQFLFPKNNFGIETKDADWIEDIDTSFLNFPTEEDWVFHGPYSDKTLMRNVLVMQIAQDMGNYASRTQFVELFINGSYWGIYVIMERIKRDKNRVDIAKLNPEENEGDDLTGGYILRIDWGEPNWISQYNFANNPSEAPGFQIVYPRNDDLSFVQEQYIQSYVDSFENAMASPDHFFAGKHYSEYIDVNSFIDRLVLNEISKNVDGYRLSEYFHKDKDSNGGKLKAGPIWDFNLAFGNADYCNDVWEDYGWIYQDFCINNTPFWWREFFTDQDFVNQLNCRWQELRAEVLSFDYLDSFIDEKVEEINPALQRNFSRWPVLDQFVWPNPEVTGSYESEVENLKDFLSARLSWMDINMPGSCVTSIDEHLHQTKFGLFPNPNNGMLNIDSKGFNYGLASLKLFGPLGNLLDFRKVELSGILSLNYSTIMEEAGSYVLEIQSDELSEIFRIIKM